MTWLRRWRDITVVCSTCAGLTSMLHCGMCIWGNLYDFHVHVAGLIFTVAGTGTDGYNGDGIPATEAQLDRPQDVFVDESGNVYIADTVSGVVGTL